MEKFVKVPLATYLQIEKDSIELNYLEVNGVDNWEPGAISRSEYEEEYDLSFDMKEDDIIWEIIEE